MSHFLFVYGTCKRAQRNNHVLYEAGCTTEFVGTATTTKPYPLVTASQYNLPFLLPVKGTGQLVLGEVYRVDEQLLHKMDKFECVPMLYERKPVEVSLLDSYGVGDGDNGSVLQCVSYMLAKHHPSLLHNEFISCYDEKLHPIAIPPTQNGLPSMPSGIQIQIQPLPVAES